MKTLYHPNMRDTSIEVEDDRVAEFTSQGWRKTPKKFDADEPTESTTTTSSASGEDNNKEG